MASSVNTVLHAGDVLTAQEMQAVRFAQDVYGALALQAADGMADALRLRDDAKRQFMGGITARITELDFEGRRVVANELQTLTAQLGEHADKGAEVTLELIKGGKDGEEETINASRALILGLIDWTGSLEAAEAEP